MTSSPIDTSPQQPLDGPAILDNSFPVADGETDHTPEKPRRQHRKRFSKKPAPAANVLLDEGDSTVNPVQAVPKKVKRRPFYYRKPKTVGEANKESAVVEIKTGEEEVVQKATEVSLQKSGKEDNNQGRRLRHGPKGPQKEPTDQLKKQDMMNQTLLSGPTDKVQRSASEVPFGRRAFGRYECTDCEHKWTSANAWRGKKQGCKLCGIMVNATVLVSET